MVFVVLHYIVIDSGFASPEKTHKFFALVLQLSGGVIVLYAINSNIGIIHNSNILKAVKKLFNDFPFFRKSSVQTTILGRVSSKETIGGLRTSSAPVTIEEKISHLQRQIDWVKEDLGKQKKSLELSISKFQKGLSKETGSIKSRLFSLEADVKEISVGGAKLQAMGALFILHGSISSYIA